MKSNPGVLPIVLVQLITSAPQAFAQPITKDVFLREAPKGWAKLEDAAFRGKVKLRHTEPTESSTSECEFRDGMARIRLHVGGYSFTTWKTSPDQTTFAANRLDQEVYDHLRAPFSIYGIPLRELLADPNFKIVEVAEQPDGKIKATFTFDGDHKGEPRKFFTKGWCIVDPRWSWAITREFLENPRYQSTSSQPFWHPKMERAVEYAEGEGALPSLRRHRTLRADGTTSVVGEVLASDPTPVPPERFTFWGVWLPAGVASLFAPAIIAGHFGWWFVAASAAVIGFTFWAKRRLFRKRPSVVPASASPPMSTSY